MSSRRDPGLPAMFKVDSSVEAVIVCGCHDAAFEEYSDFYDHANGTYATIVAAEDDADVLRNEGEYRERYADPVVIGDVREPEAGGYTIPVPSDVGGESMRTAYAKGYEAFVRGESRESNPYEPDADEYEGWSGFVRAYEKRWYRGYDDARERYDHDDEGVPEWVESHRARLADD